MKLQKIIQQLDENNYSTLVRQFKKNKADKFMFMLSGYRNKSMAENDLLKQMDISITAFYTLRSRLEDKVQELLYKNTNETRIKVLQNVANVEALVYTTQRETAIGLLKKLEKELLKVDMPNELIIVYRALKKLHVYSPKYFEYSALYNKYVAFNLGQDKAEDLLSSFCKTLSIYYLNRNKDLLEILVLYKRDMDNVCKLYESHHLTVYKNILNIHFALFCPVKKEMESDATVEKMLSETISVIEAHEEDRAYRFILPIIDFLYFEYYQQLKLYKNAGEYYKKIADNIEALLLCNHSAFVFHFFISKIEYAIVNQTEYELDFKQYDVNIEDKSSYIIYNYYLASAEYYSNNYSEVIGILTKLSNEINFIDSPFLGVEINLFLALLHILNGAPNQATIRIRSATRKIAEENNKKKYRLALHFIKLLKLAISPIDNDKYENLVGLYRHFNAVNTGHYRVLEFVKLNDIVLKKLAGLIEEV